MAFEQFVYFFLLMWSVVFLVVSFRVMQSVVGLDWTEWKFQIKILWSGPKFGISRMWMYLVILHVPFLLILLYINFTKYF